MSHFYKSPFYHHTIFKLSVFFSPPLKTPRLMMHILPSLVLCGYFLTLHHYTPIFTPSFVVSSIWLSKNTTLWVWRAKRMIFFVVVVWCFLNRQKHSYCLFHFSLLWWPKKKKKKGWDMYGEDEFMMNCFLSSSTWITFVSGCVVFIFKFFRPPFF